VKAAGSDARPLPRGATLARMTGVLFQGRKTALPFAKSAFREGGRGGAGPRGLGGSAYPSMCQKASTWPAHGPLHPGRGGYRDITEQKVGGITKVAL
jgi:hypothetical protein